MSATDFRNLARSNFSFLTTEFGFAEGEPVSSNNYQVVFETAKTRIIIEGIHHGVHVRIGIASTDPSKMKYRSYDFLDLLEIRGIDDSLLTMGGQSKQIPRYAAGLREHGSDILQDDHSLFPQLEACIDRRAAENA